MAKKNNKKASKKSIKKSSGGVSVQCNFGAIDRTGAFDRGTGNLT